MTTEAQKRALKKYAQSEKGKAAIKRYQEKTKEQNKKRLLEYYKTNIQTPKGKARQTLSHMKSSSKRKGFEWSDDWWSVDVLATIIEHGRCEKTGLKFTLNGLGRTGQRNPFHASPDRIDNTKGYSPDNVQWVVFIYNVMKNNFKDEDVETFINAIKENYK